MGETLPVPELVPFRLTKELEDGMGIFGSEGHFTDTCIEVLKICQKHQELFLSLFESFIYQQILVKGTNVRASARMLASVAARLQGKKTVK
jgi:phosphatidylinositol kinase/protein kinase (PI-3  family)